MKATYTIEGKEFKLKPLRGRKARRAVPRIIELAAAVFRFASDNGVDIGNLFSEDAETPSFSILSSLVYQVSLYVGEKYDEIEEEVFPILLCCAEEEDAKKWEFIDKNATPGDLYKALWIAIQYHLNTSFGVEVQQALKNLQEAPAEEVEVEPESN